MSSPNFGNSSSRGCEFLQDFLAFCCEWCGLVKVNGVLNGTLNPTRWALTSYNGGCNPYNYAGL